MKAREALLQIGGHSAAEYEHEPPGAALLCWGDQAPACEASAALAAQSVAPHPFADLRAAPRGQLGDAASKPGTQLSKRAPEFVPKPGAAPRDIEATAEFTPGNKGGYRGRSQALGRTALAESSDETRAKAPASSAGPRGKPQKVELMAAPPPRKFGRLPVEVSSPSLHCPYKVPPIELIS